jgi:hypothetical protein
MKFLVTAAALLVAGVVVSQSASAAPPQKDSSSFKGDSASIWLSHFEPSFSPDPYMACGMLTDVSISASSNVVRTEPGKPMASTEIFANVYAYDTCTGDTLFSGYGVLTNAGFVSDGTKSASLKATIDVFNWYTGSTAPLSLNLTFTGSGDVSHGSYHSNDRWGNTTYHSRSSGAYREAIASGDVVWGGVDLMDVSSASASLSKVSWGYRVISKY